MVRVSTAICVVLFFFARASGADEPAAADAAPPAAIEPDGIHIAAGPLCVGVVNDTRSHRGLFSLTCDPILNGLAEVRLRANIRRGTWRHCGFGGRCGQFSPARAEGVACTAAGADKWRTCHTFTRRFARCGAASAVVCGRQWQLALFR